MIAMIIKGLIIGVFVSAPVGPIGILCLQRTLNRGRAHGFATALGAFLSDLLYATLAVFSMSFVIDYITEYKFFLQVIASVILLCFGIYTFFSNPVRKLSKMNGEKADYWQDFATAFGLTITNPLVVLIFIGLFAKFHYISDDTTFLQSVCGIAFIMLGAIFWWTFLVNAVNKLRGNINLRRLYVINKSTGILFIVLALVGLVHTLC